MEQIDKVEPYEGFKNPKLIKVNKNLKIAIYEPLNPKDKCIFALVRTFNYNSEAPFLISEKTLTQLINKLNSEGLVWLQNR